MEDIKKCLVKMWQKIIAQKCFMFTNKVDKIIRGPKKLVCSKKIVQKNFAGRNLPPAMCRQKFIILLPCELYFQFDNRLIHLLPILILFYSVILCVQYFEGQTYSELITYCKAQHKPASQSQAWG